MLLRIVAGILLLAVNVRCDLSQADDDKLNEAYGNNIPNTVLAIFADRATDIDALPEAFKNAVKNGILCEAANPNIEATLIAAYPGGVIDAKRQGDVRKKFTPDCVNKKADWEKCMCDDAKEPVFCLTIKGKENIGGAPSTCRDAALQGLIGTGTGAYGRAWDYKLVKKGKNNDDLKKAIEGDVSSVDGFTQSEAEEAAKYFCDAADPNVEKAFKKLVASDGAYFLVDRIMGALIFGPSGGAKEEAEAKAKLCAIKTFTDHALGGCLCQDDASASFCFFKFLGEWFKEEGYLVCGGAAPAGQHAPAAQGAGPKFDSSKKPKKMRNMDPNKPGSGSGSSAPATLASLMPLAALAGLLLLH